MKRSDLENLKAEMSTRYAEQLEREQTHLTIDQRAHMCIGFEHGMGWLWKILQAAGMSVEEEEPPKARGIVCLSCRQVASTAAWATRSRPSANARADLAPYSEVPGRQCPHCKAWQAAP